MLVSQIFHRRITVRQYYSLNALLNPSCGLSPSLSLPHSTLNLTRPPTHSFLGVRNLFITKSTSSLNPRPLSRPRLSLANHLCFPAPPPHLTKFVNQGYFHYYVQTGLLFVHSKCFLFTHIGCQTKQLSSNTASQAAKMQYPNDRVHC